MNLLDLLIVVLAVGYAIGGFRNGAVVGLLSMLGFLGGAAVGIQVGVPLSKHLAHGTAQVPVAVMAVLLMAMAGQLVGVWAATRIRGRLVPASARYVDAGIGAALGILSVLLVAWLVAVPLASAPYPALAAEASHSSIVRAVNAMMPNTARQVYSSMRTFLDRSGFPPVFGDLPSTTIVDVAPPDATLSPQERAVVAAARQSVFKIYGRAPSCGRMIEGSGFVYAPERILTNAHVVAGTDSVTVQAGAESLPAAVVLYDSKRDVAVLDVPGLRAPALRFARQDAATGEPALVLGFPEDGPFTAGTARIRSRFEVTGNDIYGTHTVTREVYAVRAVVRSGNSGGPLVGDDGTVSGMVFATALDSSDTGYALTDDEIGSDATAGVHAGDPVGTGSCTPG
jgi:S1-C subfamily serine protease